MDRDDLDARFAAAVRRNWRDLDDAGGIAGPRLLGDLAAVAEQHAADTGVIAVRREDDLPTDEQVASWIRGHPDEFAAIVAKQNRIEGIPDMPALRGERTAAPRSRARTPKAGES